MNMDENDFILTEAELAAAQRDLELTPTVLGLNPRTVPPPEPAVVAVPPEEQDRFRWMMATLADPAKRVLFHYTVGDESLTRSVAAWGRLDDGEVATMAQTGTLLRFGTRSGADLTLVATDVLAIGAGVQEYVLGLTMSRSALLTWLGIVEHLKTLRLSAMLSHHEPEHFFDRAAVATRLASSVSEDFRWPLMFFAKVLPNDDAAAFAGADFQTDIADLEALELVEDAGGGVWEVTPQGVWLANEVLDAVSKVGCGVAATLPDKTIGYRTMMFVRSALHVLLFMIDGEESVLAAVSADRAVLFLDEVFAGPRTDVAPTTTSSRCCSVCGAELQMGDRFCAKCGTPVEGGGR